MAQAKKEMVRILCKAYPDHPYLSSERYERSRALATIAQIEGEHAADPKKGCAGPHEVEPA